jgi:hypothetical protein
MFIGKAFPQALDWAGKVGKDLTLAFRKHCNLLIQNFFLPLYIGDQNSNLYLNVKISGLKVISLYICLIRAVLLPFRYRPSRPDRVFRIVSSGSRGSPASR